MTEQTKTHDQLLTDAYEAGRLAMDPGRRLVVIENPKTGAAIPVTINENDGGAYVAVATDVLTLMRDQMPAPDRARGTREIHELEAFIAYVNRFKTPTTIIWADTKAFTLTAVLNEEGDAFNPAWRDHRAVYACPRSVQWQTWTANDGRAMAQEAFADFIEANIADIASAKGYPSGAELLTMARDLLVLTKGTYQRQINPTTGAGILVCKSETETGSTQIPRAFAIAVPVFDGGDPYQVEARVRFALGNGQPSFTYTLHRRAEIERDAFMDARVRSASGTDRPVIAGKAG